MKRSEINSYIGDAIEFFAKHSFPLPAFAHWDREIWRQLGHEADEIRRCRLGWDITDFNSGNFVAVGLTLFTLRNGDPLKDESHRCYAEKIMHVREQQVTPFHLHYRKTEDIINRGNSKTGNLAVQLYNSTKENGFADTEVTIFCDGIRQRIDAGGTVVLRPGESITIPPRLYHSFHAVDGPALIGEVSSVNEDDIDNHFHQPIPRFPEIIEDELPFRLLCTEYPQPKLSTPRAPFIYRFK